MHTEPWALLLLVAVLVLLAALTAVRLSGRLGVPTLLLYLALGLALGERGAGLRFDDVDLARMLGYLALAVILTEGGLTTRWPVVRPVAPAAIALSTVGVVVTVAVTGLVARWVLGFDWRLAFVTGAVLAPTDAAAVFATLRGLALRRRVAAVLEAESGSNDPLAVILVVGLSTGTWSGGDAWLAVPLVLYQVAAGAAVGVLTGRAARAYLRRVALPASGLYPLAVFGFALGSFAAATAGGASGFLAVYVTALLLGNSTLPHRPATLAFAEGLAWLAQIGLFVMLGLLAWPARLPSAVLPALAVGAALVLVARPLSVTLATLPFGFGLRERLFVSWAGLRGAVPVVLATVPLTERLPRAERVFDVVFVLVVVLTLVQAPTLPRLARRLRLTEPPGPTDLAVEAAPLGRIDADLLHLVVGAGSHLHGLEVWELRLPARASVTLVVRDAVGFVPDRWTRLQRGDQLLVVTARGARDEVEHRLELATRLGRIPGWYAGP